MDKGPMSLWRKMLYFSCGISVLMLMVDFFIVVFFKDRGLSLKVAFCVAYFSSICLVMSLSVIGSLYIKRYFVSIAYMFIMTFNLIVIKLFDGIEKAIVYWIYYFIMIILIVDLIRVMYKNEADENAKFIALEVFYEEFCKNSYKPTFIEKK